MTEETNENQLEEARKRKLIELKIKQNLLQVLDGVAYERLMNVKIANEDLYAQIVNLLLYLYQNGQIKGRIGEPELKNLLSRVLSKKEEGKIKFVRK